jgi:hypothetical protein
MAMGLSGVLDNLIDSSDSLIEEYDKDGEKNANHMIEKDIGIIVSMVKYAIKNSSNKNVSTTIKNVYKILFDIDEKGVKNIFTLVTLLRRPLGVRKHIVRLNKLGTTGLTSSEISELKSNMRADVLSYFKNYTHFLNYKNAEWCMCDNFLSHIEELYPKIIKVIERLTVWKKVLKNAKELGFYVG